MNNIISKTNSIITKSYLQEQPENQYFECKGIKGEKIKPVRIADELIGMLNAGGGILVLGIEDNREISDLNTLTEEELSQYRTLVVNFIKPSCNIKLEELIVDNKLIFVFHVEPDYERIFSRKDTEDVFLRVADTNKKLNREQVRKLEYDKNIRKFEDETIDNFLIEDLDSELLNKYKSTINYEGDNFELLYKRYLLEKRDNQYYFKKSAILLFAKYPEKYIPNASVRYIRYQGSELKTGEEHNVIKDERFENNIPNLIIELHNFLRISLKDYYFLDLEKGKFIKVPEYPEEAWLEGIVNALCHRSYNLQGSAIYIKHFDDYIEISNSGPLPAQVTIENIKNERYARNPRIARVLEDMGYVRQLNEGVVRIYQSMEKSMLSEPEYKEQNANVYLTLRNKIHKNSKIINDNLKQQIEHNWKNYNDTQKTILFHLFNKGELTLIDLCDLIDIHCNTLRQYLNQFIDANIVQKLSAKKRDINAKYILNQTKK